MSAPSAAPLECGAADFSRGAASHWAQGLKSSDSVIHTSGYAVMVAASEQLAAETSVAIDNIGCLLDVADELPTGNDIVEKVLWDRMLVFRDNMGQLLAHGRQAPLVQAIHTIYCKLSPGRQVRVLIGAEFYECYEKIAQESHRQGGLKLEDASIAQLYSMLLDLVQREYAIQCVTEGKESFYMKNERARELWSPVGDIRAARELDGGWALQAAPTIGNVVAIDFDSPLARNHEPRSGVLSQKLLECTTEERELVVTKLQQALDIIDDLKPLYGALIRNCVRRIIVRKSVEEADYRSSDTSTSPFGSEHAPRQPGSIRFLNPHLSGCNLVNCVERLLHESTHNLLAAWETVNGVFVINDDQYRPVSPWSGNPIPNSSFVHATFIYYMCRRLFQDLLVSSYAKRANTKRLIADRLSNFTAGFLINHSIYDQLLLHTDPKHEVRKVLEELQDRVKKQSEIQ